eukprot:COSAG06_NODE_39474_length_412_cov_0.798722_1_plen_24_part_10
MVSEWVASAMYIGINTRKHPYLLR